LQKGISMEDLIKISMEDLKKIRHHIHRNPELSGKECKTREYIHQYLQKHNATQIFLSSKTNCVVGVFGTGKETILLRADMDALPIQELNTHDHVSQNEGVMHACGHDGHTTMLLGLVPWLVQQNLDKYSVTLVFQSAEETGQGAFQLLEEPFWKDIKVKYAFGIHNMPQFPKGQILLREKIFAPASTGMIIELQGRASHASEPENGINPTQAMTQIIPVLTSLPQYTLPLHQATKITIVGAQLGQRRFGTSPEIATIFVTLRAHETEVLEKLKKDAEHLAKGIATAYGLKTNISYEEYFPAVENHPEALKIVQKATQNQDTAMLDAPAPWSEDFSYFAHLYPSTYFGIGSGENMPNLHNPDYDFPDEILPIAIKTFINIIQEITTSC